MVQIKYSNTLVDLESSMTRDQVADFLQQRGVGVADDGTRLESFDGDEDGEKYTSGEWLPIVVTVAEVAVLFKALWELKPTDDDITIKLDDGTKIVTKSLTTAVRLLTNDNIQARNATSTSPE